MLNKVEQHSKALVVLNIKSDTVLVISIKIDPNTRPSEVEWLDILYLDN